MSYETFYKSGSPTNPGAGKVTIWIDATTGLLKQRDENGVEKDYLASSDPLPVFGQNYQREVSLSRSTTTSDTYQTKVTLTTPALTGTYRVAWGAMLDQSSIADQVQARCWNNTDSANVPGLADTDVPRIEPHDADDRIAVSQVGSVTFTGSAKTFLLQYRQQSGSTAGISGAWIEIWRVA